jgi:hypothetical protein
MPAPTETSPPEQQKIDNWAPLRGCLIMCAVMGGVAILGFLLTQAIGFVGR